jgi:hypothetical protein
MMKYEKNIALYRKKLTDERIIKFVDFLETLEEWLERLQELKRIPYEHKKDIEEAFPKKIFVLLDTLLPTTITDEKYISMKKLLLGETTQFIHSIINFTGVQLHDFDLLQFNLYQIFGKEELASMVEWARLHLEEEIERKTKEVAEEKALKQQEEEAHLKYINSLSEDALRKRAIQLMFDFTPSARTTKERRQAIRDHRKTVHGHRVTFHKFEMKLVDATENARKEAQMHVYGKMGAVEKHMDIVSTKFKKKAAEFVSTEGPQKKMRHAREKIEKRGIELQKEMVEVGQHWEKSFGLKVAVSQKKLTEQSERLHRQIVKKEKSWKKEFMIDVASARDSIGTTAGKLAVEAKEKGKEWKRMFKEDIAGAQQGIKKEQDVLYKERATRAEEILQHGSEEFGKASTMIETHREDFSDDVAGARERFSGKGKVIEEKRQEMGAARVDFIEKRDSAATKFTERGVDIETEMYGTIYKEKRRFEKERSAAQLRFSKRAREITGTSTGHLTSKKQAFQEKHTSAGKRFLERAKQFGGTPQRSTTDVHPAEEKAIAAKGKMSAAQTRVTTEGKRRQAIMKENMQRQRDLFQYDVRFAQHRIKKNAERFAEEVAAKQEEFVSEGEKLVARHKAKQKSNLIRNLLRTIRTMK